MGYIQMKTGLAFLFALVTSASTSFAADAKNCGGSLCPKGTTCKNGVCCDPTNPQCGSKILIKKLEVGNVFEVTTDHEKSIKVECPDGYDLKIKEKAKDSEDDVLKCQKMVKGLRRQ